MDCVHICEQHYYELRTEIWIEANFYIKYVHKLYNLHPKKALFILLEHMLSLHGRISLLQYLSTRVKKEECVCGVHTGSS